jgi:hypothetical protein
VGCTWQVFPSLVHRLAPHSEESVQVTQQTLFVPTPVRTQFPGAAQSALDVQDAPRFFRFPQVVADPQTVELGQEAGVPFTLQLPAPSQRMGVNMEFAQDEPHSVPVGAR